MNLEGKVAVVTGSATGIGQGIAVELAKQGAFVVVTYNQSPADETMRLIKEVSGTAIAVNLDVSKRESIHLLFAKAQEAFGGIDILVNNAARQLNHWLLQYTVEEYKHVMDVNLKAYWMCMQEVLPYMKQSKCGRIINISSVHGKRPTGFDAVYGMSKGGIKMLTREAAIEFSKYSITVNTLTLGAIKVGQKSGNPEWKPVNPPPTKAKPLGTFLSGRPGIPSDAAYLVAFLASEESVYMTGESIRTDGGAMLV